MSFNITQGCCLAQHKSNPGVQCWYSQTHCGEMVTDSLGVPFKDLDDLGVWIDLAERGVAYVAKVRGVAAWTPSEDPVDLLRKQSAKLHFHHQLCSKLPNTSSKQMSTFYPLDSFASIAKLGFHLLWEQIDILNETPRPTVFEPCSQQSFGNNFTNYLKLLATFCKKFERHCEKL